MSATGTQNVSVSPASYAVINVRTYEFILADCTLAEARKELEKKGNGACYIQYNVRAIRVEEGVRKQVTPESSKAGMPVYYNGTLQNLVTLAGVEKLVGLYAYSIWKALGSINGRASKVAVVFKCLSASYVCSPAPGKDNIAGGKLVSFSATTASS